MNATQNTIIPTLDDVARAAGVSTATVSRCLNTADKVSETTRARVMRAVEALGYTPNFGARAMAAKRTFTIGAIVPTMENAIFARGLQAFQENLNEKGYTLLVSSSGYSPEAEAEQVRTLVARGADGLLLIGYERDSAIYDYLMRRGVPTLLAWAYQADNTRPSIGFDNRATMMALADKVLDLGHRDLAVISGIVKGNDRAAERVEGIKDAARARGLDPEAVQVVETTYEIESGASAFEDLITRSPRPSVVMCVSDVLGVGALRRAREMGFDVPGDVSITGFDDMELARIVTPQLTTVHVPHREMGWLAAEELVRMVENKAVGTASRLECAIELRGSTRDLTGSA